MFRFGIADVAFSPLDGFLDGALVPLLLCLFIVIIAILVFIEKNKH